jgi:hypothetical protein
MDDLSDRYRVLAVNLFGYGETTPWPDNAFQSLYAQAMLILSLGAEALHHAGATGAEARAHRAESLRLAQAGGQNRGVPGSAGVARPRQVLRILGQWDKVVERFADYWGGEGNPNFYEWDAVMSEEARLARWKAIPAATLVLSDPQTRRPIREIIDVFMQGLPRLAVRVDQRSSHGAAHAAGARQSARPALPRRSSIVRCIRERPGAT